MSRKKKKTSPEIDGASDVNGAPEIAGVPEVQITSTPEVPSPKDAGALNPDDYRFQPLSIAGREFKFQAIFTHEALQAIHEHGKTSMDAEICGVLVGNVYRDSYGPYVLIRACIRGDAAESRNAQVTFKAETWTHIQQVMEQDHPDDKIVGWYHTHPGFGIFLSGMDLFIQDNFFNLPWQIALVYDPQSEEEGVFIWRNGKSEREPHLVEASATPQQEESRAMSDVAATNADQLTPRTWAIAGILFVLSFGLTYALIALLRAAR